jgi:hypothetical protein
MTPAEYSFGAFAVLNATRLFGYIPKMLRLHRDKNGAEAISLATWCLFAAANVATASYGYVVADDAAMTIVFSVNSLGCLAIAGLAGWNGIGRIGEQLTRQGPMQAFVKRMSPDERKAWRAWRAQWIGIYAAVIIGVIGLGTWQSGGRQVADVGTPVQFESLARNAR